MFSCQPSLLQLVLVLAVTCTVLQCHQRRTKPRSQGICTKNFVTIDPAVPEICSQTDRQTTRSQYSARLPGQSNNTMSIINVTASLVTGARRHERLWSLCTSVYTTWHHTIWQQTAQRCHVMLADDTCDLLIS